LRHRDTLNFDLFKKINKIKYLKAIYNLKKNKTTPKGQKNLVFIYYI